MSRRAPILAILLSSLALTSCSAAHRELRAGCFEEHLHEAIALNEGRRALYSQHSGGASQPITDRLVRYERALIPFAWAFDSLESSRPDEGLVGLCDMFEPMSLAPAPVFGQTFDVAPMSVDVAGMARRLDEAAAARDFRGTAREAEAALDVIGRSGPTQCMLRHLLESIVRAANVAAAHEEQARAKGIAPATRLHVAFLSAHVEGLPGAADLDEDAAALQARGVPIVCSDVPPIPPLPR